MKGHGKGSKQSDPLIGEKGVEEEVMFESNLAAPLVPSPPCFSLVVVCLVTAFSVEVSTEVV